MTLDFTVLDIRCLTNFALLHEGDLDAPRLAAFQAQHWLDELGAGCETAIIPPVLPGPGVGYCMETTMAAYEHAGDAGPGEDPMARVALAYSPGSTEGGRASEILALPIHLDAFAEHVGRVMRASIRLLGRERTEALVRAASTTKPESLLEAVLREPNREPPQNVSLEGAMACVRVAKAMANRLWVSLDEEALAELVDDAHVSDEDGPAAFPSLWDAVVGTCLTIVVANRGRDIPVLQGEPVDKDNPGSMK